MNSFDDELRSALRRQEPEPGFTERVMARIAAQRPAADRRYRGLFRLPKLRWVWASVALACLALVVGAVQFRRYQRERSEGERAKEHVLLALRIASTKLNLALKEVERVDRRQPPVRAKPKSKQRTERL
jgi:anti-sigma-K factor RskA